ncbi:unnamed protein product [Urochloa decumbens]|uniref:Uncharacterized protein n=1 Tax=Urochloa decumbens TaxID=240449 RepID=A0ABC9ADX6_9POAL
MELNVQRTSRSYVRPAADTPSGSLELSAIDLDVGLRHMVRSLHVFQPRPHHAGGEEEGEQQHSSSSPARVIREALGKALMDYYPFAGRLVDGAGGPTTARVECTNEGAWFVEAFANCTLDDAACLDHHPLAIPAEGLLPDAAPGGVNPFDIPLMMQVTEFACGGFVVGLSSSHTLTDGLGAGQFINAVADYARGLPKPRVTPIWARDRLIPNPRKLHLVAPPPPPDPPALRPFRYLTVDLSLDGVNRVKSQFLAATGRRCSTFDVAVAKVWQARTRSLRLPDPSAPVTLCIFANARHLLHSEAAGFYGNCFFPATLAVEAGAVERADVAGVVGMVQDAKARLAEQFARWAAGEEVENDPYALWWRHEPLFVSDWRRLGFLEADYGWGAPLHVSPFAGLPFMPVALLSAPPAPRKGVRITTQCVEEENMPAFREEMRAFEE